MVEKSVGNGKQPFLVDSICLSIKDGTGGLPSVPYSPSPLARERKQKRLDLVADCGYICDMEDRYRDKDSMVHVRFTEDERRKLKAHCALLGISMQEYIREVTLKGLARKKGRQKK